MPRFIVTVRHGPGAYRYHTFEVEAVDLVQAMERAAGTLPAEVGTTGDLVELRRAPEPDRPYLGE